MARELRGLVNGVLAGLFVVGASYGVSALITHGRRTEAAPSSGDRGMAAVATGKAAPSAQFASAGRSLYSQMCADCHGAQAQGQFGPTLHHLHDSDAKIARSIANGFPPRMPAYKNKLSAEQIQALVAYLQTLE